MQNCQAAAVNEVADLFEVCSARARVLCLGADSHCGCCLVYLLPGILAKSRR